jgi:hypothetical protein
MPVAQKIEDMEDLLGITEADTLWCHQAWQLQIFF